MVARRHDTYAKLSRKEVTVAPFLDDSSYDGLLSPEERAELISEIEDEIHAEEVKKAKVEFKDKARTAIRIQKGLEEEQVTFLIDLPGHSDKIRIDNQYYYHGFTYTRPYSVAQTVFNMMDQAWRHEETVGGANKDAYRKPRHTGLSATRGVTNAPTPQEVLSPMSASRAGPAVKMTTSTNIGQKPL
jgi:hypothetical protein